MKTTKKNKPTKKGDEPLLSIKAKTEVGKAFITISYLTFVAVFVTQFIGQRQMPSMIETLFSFLIVLLFGIGGISFLNSAEHDEERKKIP